MIKEREILEGKLKDLILKNGKNRHMVNNVTQNLIENKNLDEGFINKIFKSTMPISQIQNEFILYAFTKAMFNATKKDPNIDPEDYFTKLEIEDGDKWKQEITVPIKDKQPVIFNPCIRINSNQWSTVLTIQQLYDLFNVRSLTYNTKTQRPLQVREINGKIVEKIDINPTSVRQIKDLLIKGLYFQDPITINCLISKNLNIEEDVKNLIFTLFSGELNLTDGWHRLRAMFKALIEDATLGDIKVPITLTKLTESRASDYVSQKSKHNDINPNYAKTIDPTRLANQIIEYLNTESKSLLWGRVTKDAVKLKDKNNKFVVEFNTLADTIDFTFNPKDQSELYDLNEYIMQGLNYIIHTNIHDKNLLKEPADTKTWCIYMCALYIVKDVDDWKKVLDDVLLNINMKNIIFKTINKTTVRNIVDQLKQSLSKDELESVKNENSESGDYNE